MRDDAIVAHAVDGGPLRLVVPGAPGPSVERLVRLERK